MKSVVALVDCNSFYVSCERVFRPELKGKPVVVLSNNDGCIVSRSSEVKALGVEMGIPAFKIEDLIRKKEIYAFSSNYSLYGDLSARVMNVLSHFTPEMEVYSIDEAFLDLSGFPETGLAEYGRTIKQTVEKWTGIPVSIGIGETKVLAKIANRLAKKFKKTGGVLNLTGSPDLDKVLGMVAVEDVWGIGRQHTKLLRRYGIATALDLRNADDGWVKKHLTIVGLRLVKELRGEPCIVSEDAFAPRKQICVSRSFGKYVTTLREMEEAIATYTERASEKLRSDGSAAGVVMVFMMTNRFREGPQYAQSTTVEMPVPTFCTQELIKYTMEGTRRLFRMGFRFNKAGVILAELVPENEIQMNLFDTIDREKSSRLMEAIDRINGGMGKSTLKFAVAGMNQDWKTKFTRRSPRYTTSWDEIPVAG